MPATNLDETPEVTAEPGPVRAVAGRVVTALAMLVVWFALIFPDQLGRFTPGALVRLPIEGLLLVALGLVLSGAPRRVMATIVGVGLGLLVILKILDLAFFSVLGQPFNPRTDLSYLKSAVGVLRDSTGPFRTVAAVVAAVVVLLAVLVLVTRSVLRVTRSTTTHRASSAWTVSALAVVWLLCAALGVQVAGGRGRLHRGRRVHPPTGRPRPRRPGRVRHRAGCGTAVRLAREGRPDRVRRELRPGGGRGPGHRARGERGPHPGTDSLRAAGFSSRSAFLTSPTFAGISWLAHGTLQSGLVDRQPAALQQLLQRPAHAECRLQASRLADRRRRSRRTPRTGRRARRSTTTTRSTTAGTSATRDRVSATPPCPTSTRWPRCTATNWRDPDHAPGDGRGRPGVLARSVGAAAADGRLEGGRRRLGLRRHARAGTDAQGPARSIRTRRRPRTVSRSSTR